MSVEYWVFNDGFPYRFNFAVKISIIYGLNWFIGTQAMFIKVQYIQLIHISLLVVFHFLLPYVFTREACVIYLIYSVI